MAALVMGAAVIGLPGSANAQEVIYGASACFSGEADPRSYVAVSNGPTFFSNVILLCGDPTKGVIHIDDAHPIAEDGSDDEDVRDCHHRVMFLGHEVESTNPQNRVWEITRPEGGFARVVFDKDTLETVTMFTSDSNNWAACARFPD